MPSLRLRASASGQHEQCTLVRTGPDDFRTLLVLCSGCDASSDSSATASDGARLADTCRLFRILVSVRRTQTHRTDETSAIQLLSDIKDFAISIISKIPGIV